ncbi:MULTISPECIES: FmdB family zinc ribbon protein [Calditerrivibrio]|jgi:putative FmdB family regulatory protein|uniref:Zinc ribbon domain-containing protein n=1 Tax=Calditerrivibrio nitroreducens TaxID=477976 RepID=A0A2J6WLV5_9BACT|nr:MAG: zinc ribbon domain-containing protein [Calditerrivibrio nitroreducens]
MPIYEFRCNDCGKQFSKLILKKDDTAQCPNCKSENVEKLISAVSSFSSAKGGSSSSCGGGFSGFR